jgi:hypothetical protein
MFAFKLNPCFNIFSLACHCPKRRAPCQPTKFVDILGEPRVDAQLLAGARFSQLKAPHIQLRSSVTGKIGERVHCHCGSCMAGQVGKKNVERSGKLLEKN